MKKPDITYSDFDKLELIVGEVKEVMEIEGSDKLFKLTVDLGDERAEVTILAGVKQGYSKEAFLGKKFIFIANLSPRAMMGETSEGMMLAGDASGKAILIPVPDEIPAGTIIR